MRRRKHSDQPFGLDTTATADISFMLLVFFLVTTSMYVDKGLLRQLPPRADDEAAQQEICVDRENIMAVALSSDGTITLNDSVVAAASLAGEMKTFILRREEQHLFTIVAAGDCPYSAYYTVQNALADAYRAAREALAQSDYGQPWAQLTDEQQAQLFARLPQRVAEDYLSDDNNSHAH